MPFSAPVIQNYRLLPRESIAGGVSALQDNTDGERNIALGGRHFVPDPFGGGIFLSVLGRNTSGGDNIGIGLAVLANNTLGFRNVGIGSYALLDNITGGDNIGIGVRALVHNTSGGGNIGIGTNTLLLNTTGWYNLGIGFSALHSNRIGHNNLGIGFHALSLNDAGNNNLGIGNNALRDNYGNNNLGIGIDTLRSNTTGNNNTAIGINSGQGITNGSNNTILGPNVTGLAAGLTDNIILATGQGTIRGRFDALSWIFHSPVRTLGYTVATLPAGTLGDRAFVTDAVAPTYNGPLVGGGTVAVPVFRNATGWVSA